MADLSREESKRLRAELVQGLGYFPASLARPERKPVNATGGVQAATSGASGITSRKNGAAQRSKLRAVHRCPTYE